MRRSSAPMVALSGGRDFSQESQGRNYTEAVQNATEWASKNILVCWKYKTEPRKTYMSSEKSGERAGWATQFICSSSRSLLKVKECKFTQKLCYTSTYAYMYAIYFPLLFLVFLWYNTNHTRVRWRISSLCINTTNFWPWPYIFSKHSSIFFPHILSEPGFKYCDTHKSLILNKLAQQQIVTWPASEHQNVLQNLYQNTFWTSLRTIVVIFFYCGKKDHMTVESNHIQIWWITQFVKKLEDNPAGRPRPAR